MNVPKKVATIYGGITVQQAASFGLLALMYGISTRLNRKGDYGWYPNIDHHLWRVRIGVVDHAVATDRQATLLALLSDEAGGWWSWPMAPDGSSVKTPDPSFLTLEDWEDYLAQREARA